MPSDLIKGIVYAEFDEVVGPNSVCWVSLELSEETIDLIGLKTMTFLAVEQGITPSSLVLVPFPSLKLKAVIKFIEIMEKNRLEEIRQSAITLVFKEEDDAIFYKHVKDIESYFNDSAKKILELELSERNEEKLIEEIKKLQIKISYRLRELEIQEQFAIKSEVFPEIEGLSGYQFKIIVCGDPYVGKTSIILRFTKSAFSRTYLPTIGVNVSEKTLFFDKTYVHLIFWDIAGQSKFERLRKYFYKGANGILLVFDLTNPDSMNNINEWYNDIKISSTWRNGPKGFLIGNKKDLTDSRKVVQEHAINLAKKLKLGYIESSALTGENINEVFNELAKDILSLTEK